MEAHSQGQLLAPPGKAGEGLSLPGTPQHEYCTIWLRAGSGLAPQSPLHDLPLTGEPHTPSGLRIPHWNPLDGIASQTRKDVGTNVAAENVEPPKCPLLEAFHVNQDRWTALCNLYQDVFVSNGNHDKCGFRVAQALSEPPALSGSSAYSLSVTAGPPGSRSVQTANTSEVPQWPDRSHPKSQAARSQISTGSEEKWSPGTSPH